MTTPRNHDGLIRTYLREDPVSGQAEVPDHVYNAIRDGIEQTRQRAVIGSMGVPDMNKFLAIGLGTAAVVAVLLIGSNLLGSGSPPPGDAPSPSVAPSEAPSESTPVAATVASGSFTASLGEFGEAFDIEATKTGDDVSGTLDVSFPSGADGGYSVDLQCARTTDAGNLIIAGKVSDSASDFIAEGVYVAMLLAPGPPAGTLWFADVLPFDEVPSPADSCSGFLDTIFSDPELPGMEGLVRPIEGDVELGQ